MDKKYDPTKFVWPREAILKLVEMWQENECLYNPRHAQYHNKRARFNVIRNMADNLQDFSPDIGPTEVKNKITYLRGQYTREIARTKETSRSSEDAYVPTVFWFREMQFLEDFVNKKKSSSNSLKREQLDVSGDDSSQMVESNISPPPTFKRARVSSDTAASSHSMSQENIVELPGNSALQTFAANAKNKVNDKDEAFCTYIKMELNEITNTNIKDELIEKITLAVFEAKKEQRYFNNDIDKSFANF